MEKQDSSMSQGERLLYRLFSQGKRIFNTQEALETAALESIPYNQLRKILSNLSKHKRLLRLRRGLYVGIGLLPEHRDIHPFVISSFLIQPSVISHWSALQHHGLTEQIPTIITASTPKKVSTPFMRNKSQNIPEHLANTLEIEGMHYTYITIPKEYFFNFGIEKIWINKGRDGLPIANYYNILITDRERTLLDVFAYPKMFGGMGEALGILENALSTINISRLIEYAIKYNKKPLIKRVGCALEYFNVSAEQLEPLLEISMNYYCRLDSSLPPTGHCDSRWMIQNNLG